MLRIISFTVLFWATLLFANTAEAASLFFTPGTGEFGLNKEISVDLKIDSSDTGINAGQATIRFPKDILAVRSIDKTDSTFNFWLEEPTFSNETGVISFVGGTPYGISGASIQVLHIVFTTKSAGTAPITIVDSAVTASDGSGTNVLLKTTDATYTITPSKGAPVVVAPPAQIVRKAAPAVGLPIQPAVQVSLYPDPIQWYNHSDIFTASWVLPKDITGVATALNKQPNYAPTQNEGLFDSKAFQPVSDGASYLHVRFKNSIGWGAINHYRIAVDTKAPLPFEIISEESKSSNNPTPSLNFESSDGLSGVLEYRLRVDNGAVIVVSAKEFSGSYKLPTQKPGVHHLAIQAVDNAGNSIENTFDYEVLPLALPSFTFVTDKLFSDEVRGLTLRGTGLPSTEMLVSLKRGSEVILSSSVPVDANGNWEFTSSQLLLSGQYIGSIQNRDSRGALSLTVNSDAIQVAGKYTTLIIAVIVALITAIAGGFWFFRNRRERTSLRIQIAERDTDNVFKMIQADVQKLQDAQKTPTTADDEFIAEKLKNNVEKMSVYVKDEISRAKK